MKIQDVLFILVLVMLLAFQKPRLLLVSGLICFLLAIPLFATWVFFTGERLAWYGAAFIFVYLLISLLRPSTVK